jgi:hypothetical protein
MLGFFSDRAEVGITPFSLVHGSALMAAFEPEAGRPGCRLAIALVLGAFGTALAQGGGGGGGRRRRGRRRGWGRSRCNRRGIERRRPNWRECGSNGIRVRIEAVSPGTTGAGPKNQGGSGATGTGTDIDKSPSRKAVTTFTAIRTRFNATRVRSPRSWFSEFFLAGRSQRSQRASGIASPRPVPKSLRRRAGIADRAVRGRDTSSTLVDRAA